MSARVAPGAAAHSWLQDTASRSQLAQAARDKPLPTLETSLQDLVFLWKLQLLAGGEGTGVAALPSKGTSFWSRAGKLSSIKQVCPQGSGS